MQSLAVRNIWKRLADNTETVINIYENGNLLKDAEDKFIVYHPNTTPDDQVWCIHPDQYKRDTFFILRKLIPEMLL
jgi:hypothetical protein